MQESGLLLQSYDRPFPPAWAEKKALSGFLWAAGLTGAMSGPEDPAGNSLYRAGWCAL